MKPINIIGKSKLWLAISVAIVVLAFGALLAYGLNFGIDFTGGSLMQISAPGTSVSAIREAATAGGFESVVQQGEGDTYFVRLAPVTEEQHQMILSIVRALSVDAKEIRFDTVGPVIGDELRSASISASVLMLILILVYVAWAFRKVTHPVASWKYGVVTMIAAFHDVMIPLGVFAVLGHYFGYQVDMAFVAAVLTILGYSINDTIVVLDRTRENLLRRRHSDMSFGDIVNSSIMETLARSLNTTFSSFLPLFAVFLVGGETTRPFVLALMIGLVSGAYSSIFIASPLLVEWERWRANRA
ncbi:MAG: protein translocase subunit SecF [Patescibacteria group bacterium]|jgi:preprotein translocase subunit SecF